MSTNEPKPFRVSLSNTSPSFMVNGYNGYYARVTIRLTYTGSSTIAVSNPATNTEYDTLTSTDWGLLVYLIENLNEPLYNIVTSTVGTFSGFAQIEYHRTTSLMERT